MEGLKRTAVQFIESYLDLQATFEEVCVGYEQVGVDDSLHSTACSHHLHCWDMESLLQQRATTLNLHAAVLVTKHVAATLLRAVQPKPQQPCQQLLSETERVCGLLSLVLPSLTLFCLPPQQSVTSVLLLADHLQNRLFFAQSYFIPHLCKVSSSHFSLGTPYLPPLLCPSIAFV